MSTPSIVVPVEVGVVAALGQGDRRRQREPDASLDLGAQPVDAALLDEVLEAGPVAVVAVAEVALGGDDRLDDVAEVGPAATHARGGASSG